MFITLCYDEVWLVLHTFTQESDMNLEQAKRLVIAHGNPDAIFTEQLLFPGEYMISDFTYSDEVRAQIGWFNGNTGEWTRGNREDHSSDVATEYAMPDLAVCGCACGVVYDTLLAQIESADHSGDQQVRLLAKLLGEEATTALREELRALPAFPIDPEVKATNARGWTSTKTFTLDDVIAVLTDSRDPQPETAILDYSIPADAEITVTLPALTADRILMALETLVSHTAEPSHRDLLADAQAIFCPHLTEEALNPVTYVGAVPCQALANADQLLDSPIADALIKDAPAVKALPWVVAPHPELSGVWGVRRVAHVDGRAQVQWSRNAANWAYKPNAERAAHVLNGELYKGYYLSSAPNSTNVNIHDANLQFVATSTNLAHAQFYVDHLIVKRHTR